MIRRVFLLCLFLPSLVWGNPSQRQMEALDRGLVAVKQGDGKVFLSWRLLGTDAQETAFDVYRVKDGKNTRLNDKPITDATCTIDPEVADEYFVRSVLKGKEGAASAPSKPLDHNYIEFPIQPIDDYRPGDASAADL
nr:hypothetical protein [Akkermansiaceae bacterium]